MSKNEGYTREVDVHDLEEQVEKWSEELRKLATEKTEESPDLSKETSTIIELLSNPDPIQGKNTQEVLLFTQSEEDTGTTPETKEVMSVKVSKIKFKDDNDSLIFDKDKNIGVGESKTTVACKTESGHNLAKPAQKKVPKELFTLTTDDIENKTDSRQPVLSVEVLLKEQPVIKGILKSPRISEEKEKEIEEQEKKAEERPITSVNSVLGKSVLLKNLPLIPKEDPQKGGLPTLKLHTKPTTTSLTSLGVGKTTTTKESNSKEMPPRWTSGHRRGGGMLPTLSSKKKAAEKDNTPPMGGSYSFAVDHLKPVPPSSPWGQRVKGSDSAVQPHFFTI